MLWRVQVELSCLLLVDTWLLFLIFACKNDFYRINWETKCLYPTSGYECQLLCSCSVSNCDHANGCTQNLEGFFFLFFVYYICFKTACLWGFFGFCLKCLFVIHFIKVKFMGNLSIYCFLFSLKWFMRRRIFLCKTG